MTVRRIGKPNFSYIKIEPDETIYIPVNQQMVTVQQIQIESNGELEIENDAEVVVL